MSMGIFEMKLFVFLLILSCLWIEFALLCSLMIKTKNVFKLGTI